MSGQQGSSFRGVVVFAMALCIMVAGPSVRAHDAVGQDAASTSPVSIHAKTEGMKRHEGFFPFYWDEGEGKIWLEIPNLDQEFLYVHGLSTGLGSNPVGLDRGQLGSSRVVQFHRVGPKVLLVERNLRYRAQTENRAERRAVEESFAQSVLWGGRVEAESDGRVLVDATPFLLRDAHGIARQLKQSEQGKFTLDASRSALYLPRTKAFPDNSEFEVILTFSSSEPGPLVRSTAPTAEAVTLRQRHSLVRLPDDGYRPRRFDPRAPSFAVTFADYAVPLDQPLEQRLIVRHRLQKRDPAVPVSEAVEPIVYYVDPGAPEPVRSALREGAGWWAEAFEAAGFRDAFRVELLPEDADPLDVRYNVIQWVHRSTRGWSYGNSVVDPRTGEILKGHVTLGSLRVRQDRLLTEGFRPWFGIGHPAGTECGGMAVWDPQYLAPADPTSDSIELALARLRQLAAHEVGHTLGFSHNFAASTYGRASVMDYPAPLVKIAHTGALDLSDAYDVGIGAWDQFAVRYAYREFPHDSDEREELEKLVREALVAGMLFVSDADARPAGAAHPLGNLWDNGSDPVAALEHAMEVRRIALEHFGERNLPKGLPLAQLEETLVPLYLHHRYQLNATAKMLGGVYFTYALRGDGQEPIRFVPPDEQRRGLLALLKTLDPKVLVLSESVVDLLPPLPFGYSDTRERFPSRTGVLFHPTAAAQVAAQMTVSNLLQHERAGRLLEHHSRDPRSPGFVEVLDRLLDRTWLVPTPANRREAAVARIVERVVVDELIELAGNFEGASDVRAAARWKLGALAAMLDASPRGTNVTEEAHWRMAADDIQRFLRREGRPTRLPKPLLAPPGSPIGAP